MYVGQTCQSTLAARAQKNGKDYEHCTYFWSAIQKYGWDNFEGEIIASNLTHDEADKFEIALIKALNTTDKNVGYNIAPGGRTNAGGMNFIDLTRQRFGKLLVIKRVENLKDKNVLWLCKCSCGNDVVLNGKALKSGKTIDCGCGNKHPKNIESQILKNTYSFFSGNNGNAKPVTCLNTRKSYGCIKDAGEEMNVSVDCIGDCCHGRSKSAGKDENGNKLIWVFTYDYEKMTEEEIQNRLSGKRTIINDMIVNIETKEVFKNQRIAAKKYAVKKSNKIRVACENETSSVKGFHWRFYKRYLKENNLTEEEARNSLFFVA